MSQKCQGCKSLLNGACTEILYNFSKGIKEFMPIIMIEKCQKWAKNTEKSEEKTYKKEVKE